jgi:DNA repair exonuclease SbcCD ATPase subunit
VGKNGSGKSAVLDAICFSLYNKPFRDITKPALVNSINQKDAVVEIEFTTEHHAFKVIRGIKPNIFEIYRDGELINQAADSRDYQEFLEKFILRLNYKSFIQIIILGSASFTPFMQLSMSDRRSIIEDLLDIQIFSLMNALVKTKQSELTARKNENKVLIENAHEKISMQSRYANDVQQDIAQLMQDNISEQAQHNKEIERLHTLCEKTGASLDSLKAKIVDKPKIEATIKKLTQLETQIEHNLNKHRKTKTFYEIEEVCPTCVQPIQADFKETQFTQLTSKIEESESGLKQIEEKIRANQTRLAEIAEVEKDITKHELMYTELTTAKAQIGKFIQKLKDKLLQLQEKKQSSGREEGRLLEHRQELEKLEATRKDTLESLAYYDAAGVLLKDTGIKTKIIRQYLPIINTLVNKYLASMDFFVNFNLDETFKETIKSRHRDDFSYASFSEGEKQRIDMALMLTWRSVAKLKNSVNTNLLILDEIFDSSMDTTGAEELTKILHNLDGANVFVISHRGDVLQDKFRSVLKFEKIQNFSHIAT